MRILTRYLIRAHAGPFLFAVSTLTALLFLTAVARQLENLAGKGLSWDVIWEFLLLSLPHTVALTLPMGVLVSVLYAFSELAAHNEVMAMKAGGLQPQRMMLPLLMAGVLIGSLMFYFNDQVLPSANHRLKNLMVDINRKSPTFVLREQVVNQIRAGMTGELYYLTASRIDNQTNEMTDIVIYDMSDPLVRRMISAERGTMAFSSTRTDLYLTLYEGVTYEIGPNKPGEFQQVRFTKQIMPLREVGNEMARRAEGAGNRSDREMTLAMLDSAATHRRGAADSIAAASLEATRGVLREALGLVSPEEDTRIRPGFGNRSVRPGASQEQLSSLLAYDDLSQRALSEATTASAIGGGHLGWVNQYQVEWHKKYTLAFACVVFVLLGAPLAIRFPRGGLGLVIAASSAIFAVYWAGLIGGENLGNEGTVRPILAMWVPNLIFTAMGLWLFLTMGREAATARGGGWDDLFWTLRRAVARPFGRITGRTPSRVRS